MGWKQTIYLCTGLCVITNCKTYSIGTQISLYISYSDTHIKIFIVLWL